jgi:hypothetical protein
VANPAEEKASRFSAVKSRAERRAALSSSTSFSFVFSSLNRGPMALNQRAGEWRKSCT